MQKTAQKRTRRNKLREFINIPGRAAEKYFNPEFERVMNSLRETDDKIRAIASGTAIGDQYSSDPISLKELIKNAKSNINRREFMTAIASLGRFHKKMQDIVSAINKLNLDVDKVHNDFLFKDLDEEQKSHLLDMKSRFATRENNLVIEAGIKDLYQNLFSERGRGLYAWEKRYPRQVKKLKQDTANLISKSENVLSLLLSNLKQMATARAVRKPDDYMKGANNIIKSYDNYDKTFKQHYNDNVKGFLEKQEFMAPTKPVDNKDLGKQEVAPTPAAAPEAVPAVPDLDVKKDSLPPPATPTTIPSPPINSETEDAYENVVKPNSAPFAAPKVPAGLVPLDTHEEVNESELEEIPPPKNAHKRFMDSLESMSNEKPSLIASHIRTYAKSIQSFDMETAVKLLKLASKIKE